MGQKVDVESLHMGISKNGSRKGDLWDLFLHLIKLKMGVPSQQMALWWQNVRDLVPSILWLYHLHCMTPKVAMLVCFKWAKGEVHRGLMTCERFWWLIFENGIHHFYLNCIVSNPVSHPSLTAREARNVNITVFQNKEEMSMVNS